MKWRMLLARPAVAGFGFVACLLTLAAGARAGSMPPFDVQGILFTPYASTIAGYSDNPDEVPDGESSAFRQFDAGLKAAVTLGGTRLKAEANGTILNYDGLGKDFRWLYEFKAGGETALTKGDLVEYDARRRRDNLDDKYDDLSHRLRAFWTHSADQYETKLGASFRNKDFLEPDTHNEFDYLMPGAELTLRLMPKAEISPFAIIRAAELDYLNQDESVIDRDASNYSLTGGVRWQPSKTFQIDVGARYNLRELDDKNHRRIDNGYADLQVQWQPVELATVKAAVWREIAEPYRRDGVAADQINFELGLVLKPAGRWRFETMATLQLEHEIGAEVDSADVEITAAGYYEINASLRAFLKGRQLWETDRDTADHTTEHAETTEILAGIETSF